MNVAPNVVGSNTPGPDEYLDEYLDEFRVARVDEYLAEYLDEYMAEYLGCFGDIVCLYTT